MLLTVSIMPFLMLKVEIIKNKKPRAGTLDFLAYVEI